MGVFAKLGKDEGGNVALTFSLAFLPVLVAVGSGIDYGRAVAEQTLLQQGTDAAALAGIKAYRTQLPLAQVQDLVQRVVATNDQNTAVTVQPYSISSDGSTMCVTSRSTLPTTLMGVIGIKTMTIGGYACSKMQLDTFEIAFAFDNSGSMSQSANSGGTKLQAAITAAKGMVTAMNSGGTLAPVTAFSLVPFSSSVNVGAQYRGATWLDTLGKNSQHWAQYKLVDTSGKPLPNLPTSRFQMFDNLNIDWGGCVEERASPLTTSDTQASVLDPQTLFVPYFSPDETDSWNPNSAIANDYLDDQGGACTKGDAFDVADQAVNGNDQTKLCKYVVGSKLIAGATTTISNPACALFTSTFNLSLCLKQGSTIVTTTPSTTVITTPTVKNDTNNIYGGAVGPNAGCVSQPLTPLTASQTTINNALSSMVANGDTQLMSGFMWALRTISPNGPFATVGSVLSTITGVTTATVLPKSYGYVSPLTGSVNHKVIILMTDGMNHWSGMRESDGSYSSVSQDPNASVYNSLGFFKTARLADPTTAANARSTMDTATVQACTNAKNAKDASGNATPYEIYTVGFMAKAGDIDAAGLKVLASCATDASHSFVATDGDAIVSVFQQIASALTKPRIAM